MKKILLNTLLLTGVTFSAQAQLPTEMTNGIQAVMDNLTSTVLTDTGEATGVGFAMYIPGYGSWQGASGVASPGEPLTVNHTMGIASHGKLYTAVILLKLQEQGLVSLDSPISQYITTPIANVDMTVSIRQLLKHESGIFDPVNDGSDAFWANVFDDPSVFWDYQDFYTMIEQPLFSKGTAFAYSNAGYTIAANIIQNVTGNSYSHNLHQYITTPLGLDMTFDAAEDTTALDAVQESQSYTIGFWWPRLGSVAAASLGRGAGSIVATPQDVVDFYKALFHESFLSDGSMQQLLDFENASGFGLGIREGIWTPNNDEIFFHGGADIGFLSEVIYNRRSGAITFLIYNTNQIPGSTYAALYDPYLQYFPKKVNDAGISKIISPRSAECSINVAPVVVLKNFGSAALTNATINYQVDNGMPQTFSWTGNIASGEELQVTLPVLTAVAGNHNLKIWTTAPNAAPEGNLYNDSRNSTFTVSTGNSLPSTFSEGFEGTTLNVHIWNPEHAISREWGRTELSSKTGTASLVKNNFENFNIGSVSYIDLPMIHLAAGSQQLSFSYAYSAIEDTNDSLEVLVSTDCGVTWVSLYNEEGTSLSQGLVYDGIWGYYPQTDAEWHNETVSLDEYSDSDIMIRFKQVNDGGNTLFLDDINVGSTLGTDDVNKNIVKVYPNPASDKVTVVGLHEGTVVSLYNVSGQKLLEVVANGDTPIDISSLAQGMYFLSTPNATAKIIKK